MPRQVCSGAILRCSLGSNPSFLTVQPHNRVIAKNPAANIHDNKPGVNFQPFGACASVGLCVPVTPNPWKLGGKPVKVGGGKILTLTEKCTLSCQIGGVIKVIDPGQSCVCIDQDIKSVSHNKTPCTGNEKTTIEGYEGIDSYTGDLPSPLQVMWYAREGNELLKSYYPDSEIRSWIRDAADYHGIPHVLMAVILQQENAPSVPKWRQFLQFGERTVTTFSAIVDEHLFGIVPDQISGGSSGFANMSRATLRDAAQYTEQNYGKNPLPEDIRYRLLGWDQDTRIPGDDYKADLYYSAAHLRQLIDRETGSRCHSGALTPEQLRSVIAAYNGTGPLAEKYADDAMELLNNAANGNATLYFYEK
ncbi:DUF4280 domain-containing protein [Coleofasciculus sp. G2-EDA-02]|uniref:DUF4280 domain-containing protein n=1 Tax=Coleofasciculus sp. G2-EDA-02 TaxID=3069529 RepID=UPI0032FC1D14